MRLTLHVILQRKSYDPCVDCCVAKSVSSGLCNVLICKRTGTESFGSKDSIYGLWGYLEAKFYASQAVEMAGYEWLSLLLRQL
jgi:hypothetical protein